MFPSLAESRTRWRQPNISAQWFRNRLAPRQVLAAAFKLQDNLDNNVCVFEMYYWGVVCGVDEVFTHRSSIVQGMCISNEHERNNEIFLMYLPWRIIFRMNTEIISHGKAEQKWLEVFSYWLWTRRKIVVRNQKTINRHTNIMTLWSTTLNNQKKNN